MRWILLGGAEIIFWSGLVTFFALRYGLKRPDWSRVVLALVIAEFIGLLLFGAIDFMRTRTWDGYQTSIVLILVYALIRGKKDLATLDGWVARRVGRWRSRGE
jgi:hypothetical protein